MRGGFSTSTEKLAAVRQKLAEQGLNGLLLTRADRFQGEEVRGQDEYLAWLTGFTGSAGVVLILADKAVIATDSRYTVQIKQQVDDALYQTIDTAEQSLAAWMTACPSKAEAKIGFDSWSVTCAGHKKLPAMLGETEVNWQPFLAHPVAAVWADRQVDPQTAIFTVDEDYAGCSAEEKIYQAAEELKNSKLDLRFISTPDAMMWLTNLRGYDLRFTPIHLCFGILSSTGQLTFITDNSHIAEKGYACISWAELEAYLLSLKGEKIAYDPVSLPVAVHDYLRQAGLNICAKPDPLVTRKACKNIAEVDGFRQAHLLDGVALSRFFHWLETKAKRAQLHEAELAQKLSCYRAASEQYICDSFATIAGWRDHGAIVHYRAQAGQDYKLSGDGVLLLDSGAHYKCGTTDITRTFYFSEAGQPADAELVRKASLVLAAHCQLASVVFPSDTNGVQLDAICRSPLWAAGLDFGHGTGHGVGHILNVHEGPVSISKRGQIGVKEGHILSNEPGYYEEGQFGIRHETLVHATAAYEGYLKFETLTCFPFDRQLIDKAYLSSNNIVWLNAYHQSVYNRLAPHLETDVGRWLADRCAPL
jgi:Xaa-Pro aminopeptidase